MATDLLIYGSYGYTGRLVTRRAVDEGLEPTIAGRRAEPVEHLATDLGLDHRVFSLARQPVVEREVKRADVVLNCAGPFSGTVQPVLSACIDSGTDYLDVAGSVDVLEWVAEQDGKAESQGVTALPGAGFGVVATDCLAAALHDELLGGTHLTIALDGLGPFSPGTVASVIEGLKRHGIVRQQGRLRRVPTAWKTREFDFAAGPKAAVTIPWGELSTGYYTTGIPNIETYATVPPYAPAVIERTRPIGPVLGTKPVQAVLKQLAKTVVSGPSAAERARSESHVYGRVVDDGGERITGQIRTPDTYDVTAMTAVEAARRTLDGEVEDGFQTPVSAFGPEFIFEFDGVVRENTTERVAVET